MHICFKMVEIDTHPHMFMADFINKYEEQIKPIFEKRDIEAGMVGVMDVDIRYRQVWEVPAMMIKCKKGSYGSYCSAVQKPVALSRTLDEITEDHRKKRLLQFTLTEVDREVAELKFILQGDKIYERHMEGQKWQ